MSGCSTVSTVPRVLAKGLKQDVLDIFICNIYVCVLCVSVCVCEDLSSLSVMVHAWLSVLGGVDGVSAED